MPDPATPATPAALDVRPAVEAPAAPAASAAPVTPAAASPAATAAPGTPGASAAPGSSAAGADCPAPTLWQRVAGIPVRAPEGWVRRRPTARERRIDLLIGIGLAGALVLSNWAGEVAGVFTSVLGESPLWARIAFPIVWAASLAVRRSHPMLALVLATAVFLGGFFAPYQEMSFTQFAYFAVLFSTGAWSRQRVTSTWLRLGITAATVGWIVFGAVATILAASAGDQPTIPGSTAETTPAAAVAYGVLSILINVSFYVGAYVLGNLDYIRVGNGVLAEAQARTLAAQREQLADQAVRLDRLRIARELHDAVAHHVSLMGLQAAVARRSLPAEGGERSAEHLGQVEASARDALEELHGILTTLRQADDGAPSPGQPAAAAASARPAGAADAAALDPATRPGEASTSSPSTRGVEQVPEIVEQVRSAGGTVELAVVGEPRRLTPGAGLATYRTVQEALTNVRKHAGPNAAAEVRLRWSDEALEVDVTDDGRGVQGGRHAAGAALPGGGRGLVGMRERAAAVGGSVEAGPREAGGFRVRLRVPTAGVR